MTKLNENFVGIAVQNGSHLSVLQFHLLNQFAGCCGQLASVTCPSLGSDVQKFAGHAPVNFKIQKFQGFLTCTDQCKFTYMVGTNLAVGVHFQSNVRHTLNWIKRILSYISSLLLQIVDFNEFPWSAGFIVGEFQFFLSEQRMLSEDLAHSIL